MTALFNPWLIIGVICALTGVFYYGHHSGYQERVVEDQAEVARLNEQSRQKEQQLTEQINQTTTKLEEANHVVNKKQIDLNRAIAAGRVRLPSPSCVSTPESPAASPGDRVETQTESDRETLRLIAQIAAEGDRAINQLNACIDAYNQVREQLNGQR